MDGFSILMMLLGICFYAGFFFYKKAKVDEVLRHLWLSLSTRLGVPQAAFVHQDSRRADIPRDQGTLQVHYPLSVLAQMNKGKQQHTSTTTYKGLAVPEWFTFETAKRRNRGFLKQLGPSSGALLSCGDVDLSDYVAFAFRVWFGEHAQVVHGLDKLEAIVRNTRGQFEAKYDIDTSVEEVSENVAKFAFAMEVIAEQLPASWPVALSQLLGQMGDAELFKAIADKLIPMQDADVRAHMKTLVATSPLDVLGMWCAYGFFDLVQEARLGHQDRLEILHHWAAHVPVSARGLKSSQARAVVNHFCEGHTLDALAPKALAATPRAVLPLLSHLFERHPQEVWEASKEVMWLLEVDEAHLWLEHLEASGFAITPEHLMRMQMAHGMHPAAAEEMLAHIRRVVSSNPEVMREDVLNDNITHVLKCLPEGIVPDATAWLARAGTASTLRALRAQLADHFPRRSSQGKAVAQLIEQLAQRVGHVGGLSLSADVQAGGLSVSGEAQQGDVAFAFDEETKTADAYASKDKH